MPVLTEAESLWKKQVLERLGLFKEEAKEAVHLPDLLWEVSLNEIDSDEDIEGIDDQLEILLEELDAIINHCQRGREAIAHLQQVTRPEEGE